MPDVTPKEARQARAWLSQRGISSTEIPPKTFARTAKKMNKSFTDLLKMIGKLLGGGQGEGEAPIASEFVHNKKEQ